MRFVMKTISRYLALATVIATALTGCAKEPITHPSESGISKASSVEPVITVDQEINQVTFALPEGTKAVIPVWLFQDNKGDWTQYVAKDGFQKIFATAGDYTVRMKLMNANGLSPDYVEKTFHIDNTIFDFGKYNTLLTGGDKKDWHIDNTAAGHLACGEPGTSGTGWWSAQPDEKKATGMYDNTMTFDITGNAYTFNPGDAGTIYVNTGITDAPYGSFNPGDGVDYNYPVEAQSTTWSWDVVGADLYLILPAKTLWPYYPNVEFIAAPRLKVEKITAKSMDLVADNGSIAWHFTLASGAAEQTFKGFKYESEFNIWRPADEAHTYSYYYAPGWAQIDNPATAYENGTYTLTFPSATSERWQAQFFIIPDNPIALSSALQYDYSVIITSSTSFTAHTKLTDTSSDGNFLFDADIQLNAYEDYVFYGYGVPGIDADGVKMVFDFGTCPDNTEITIKNIVVKDHANDDGTVVPSPDPGPDPEPEEEAFYDITGPTNFWRNSDLSVVFWYADAGWGQIADPEYEWLDGDARNFKVIMPAGIGGSEWQGQTHFTIAHSMEAAKLYDFCATLNSSEDCTITVKVAWEGNDNDHAAFYTNSVELSAYEDFTFKMPKIAPDVDYDRIAVFFDFGRTPAGAEVFIKDVCLQEHQDPKTGTEIWDNSKVTLDYWYADAGWAQIANPETSEIEGGWSFVMPAGIGGSEWQGQTKFYLDAGAKADKKYNFSVVLNSSEDCVCTVKLAWKGNDNDHAFFYVGDVQLSAYEDIKFEQKGVAPDVDYDNIALFVDLGRTPAGATVEVKNISLKEL